MNATKSPRPATDDPGRTMALLFTHVLQTFRDALGEEIAGEGNEDSLETGDLVLINYVLTAPDWREQLIPFLLNVTGDDPQRILGRALEAGRIETDSEGRLLATSKVEELMGKLGPVAQRYNTSWRSDLAEAFSPTDLETFLGMLQHASS